MKVLVMTFVMLFACSVVMADDTGGAKNYDYQMFNDYLNHNHSYTDKQYDRENPMGLGLDVVVYEAGGALERWGLDAVEVQQKYDFPNKEYSLFGVCKVNLWRAVFGK